MTDNLKVLCITSDKYLWAVKPFSVFFNRYWSDREEVLVAGYTPPRFDLPSNFNFFSIDSEPYPAGKYVDGLMKVLKDMKEDRVIIVLEDYWMMRPVDVYGVRVLNDYMQNDPSILRVDLTADRLYAGGMKDIGFVEHYDLIQAEGSQYEFSMQAGIWNRRALVDLLNHVRADKRNPWDLELYGTELVNRKVLNVKVIGTRQYPVRYANAMLKGKLDYNQLKFLDPSELEEIKDYVPDYLKEQKQ